MASVIRKLLNKIALDDDQKTDRWANEDIRPVPPERQLWGRLQFVELWFCINLNMSSYQTGSALLTAGLTYRQAIIVIMVGNLMATSFAVLNSVSGAHSHLGFPIVSRSVWGMYGAYFPILNRILTSIVWYGVQAVIGGNMIYVCLRSIWLDLDDRIPNHLPESMGITSPKFLGYGIFNILCAVFIWFRPTQLRPYFHFASALVFITLFVLLGWAVGTTKGYGSIYHQKDTLSSSALGWQMVLRMMSVIGSIASGILNQNDYTRFAKRPSQVILSQAGSFMVSSCVVAVIGIVVTAATQEEYGAGTALWDPTELFVAIQNKHGSRGRAAVFFLAVVFIFSQLSINVVGNVLAGGLDVASVFPRYINLRRGAYVLAILSICPNPWRQLASGSIFLSVLSAYSVFLGPMIGLLCVHYYIIQKRVFVTDDLYEGSSKSIYWYYYGTNWRTVLAWVCAVVPSMPGLVASINTNVKVSSGATHFFNLCFVVGFVIAAFVAYVLHLVFPYPYPTKQQVLEARSNSAGSHATSDVEVGAIEVGAQETKETAYVATSKMD